MSFDRKFQGRLLRALFQSPKEAKVMLGYLAPAWFRSDVHRWVLQKMVECWDTHDQAPSLTVLQGELVREKKQKVVSGPQAEAIAGYVRLLRKPVKDKSYLLAEARQYAETSAVSQVILDLATRAAEDDIPSIDEFTTLTKQLQHVRHASLPSVSYDYYDQLTARLDESANFVALGIPTGLPLDNDLRHKGLAPGELGVVLSGTGGGKSILLTHIGAQAILVGKNVLHITLEMDERQTAKRYDACFSNMSMKSHVGLRGKLAHKLDQLWKKGSKKHDRAKPGTLKIFYKESGLCTMDIIRGHLNRLESEAFYPEMIILDYVDIMALKMTSRDSRHEILGQLYVELRAMAAQLNVPLWTASQVNRQGYGEEEYGISSISGSMEKAFHSDLLISLNQKDHERGGKKARIKVVKSRNGLTGKVHPVNFDPSRVHVSGV